MFDVRGALREPSSEESMSVSETSSSTGTVTTHSPILDAIELSADSDNCYEPSKEEEIFDPLRFPLQNGEFESRTTFLAEKGENIVILDGISNTIEDTSNSFMTSNMLSRSYEGDPTSRPSNCATSELQSTPYMPSNLISQTIPSSEMDTETKEPMSSFVLSQLEFCLPETEIYEAETVDFPSSPDSFRSITKGALKEGVVRLADAETDESKQISQEEEDDNSLYTATACPPTGRVMLRKANRPKSLEICRKRLTVTKELLNVSVDEEQHCVSSLSYRNSEEEEVEEENEEEDEDDDAQMLSHDEFTGSGMLTPDDIDTPDELEDSIMERLGPAPQPVEPAMTEPSTSMEGQEERSWRSVVLSGIKKRIDLKVIEPYKKVLSHGGYMFGENNDAIIVFSACFLPNRSRKDYDYVMDHLFMYVLTTLDQLIGEDYVLVYLHGATTRGNMPSFAWIKRCYQMIDRRLRKNLQGLYLVHPTFWVKTVVLMARPFVSSKFARKLRFIASLRELSNLIPLDQVSIPTRVKQYDEIRESLLQKK